MELSPKESETVQNIVARLEKEIVYPKDTIQLKRQSVKVKMAFSTLNLELDILNDIKEQLVEE